MSETGQQLLRRFNWIMARAKPLNLYLHLTGTETIVVAGVGRSGTTMLYKSLLRCRKYQRLDGFILRLEQNHSFGKGRVYKTHDLPPASLPAHVRVIFLFGNPMNAAISAHWAFRPNGPGHQHYQQVDSPYGHRHDEIFTEDVLLMERQFKAWYQQQNFDLLAIRYEALYQPEVRTALNDFLGFDFELPPPRTRRANWLQHPRKDDLENTYGELNRRIEAVEDFRFWPRRIAPPLEAH